MSLSKKLINQIIQQEVLLDDLSDKLLAEFCELANQHYRQGNPIISDEDYDFVYLSALKDRIPNHPLLQSVEPEGQGFSEEKILLPEVMLSTDKAYTWDELAKWLERIEKAANEIMLNPDVIEIKATPKLDGFAGYDDGVKLYTRGDGKKGSDISRVFARGLQIYNHSERGQGAGEIVVKKSYFEKYLSGKFEYPRNFQASLIKEKALEADAQQAIDKKAALFVPFAQLPSWKGKVEKLRQSFEEIINQMLSSVDFDVDGVVFEVLNTELKEHMGANRKFHRWQIAYKENKDKAQVRVLSVTAQVGRTGKITPVAELEPTLLSGATIHRATAHHFGLVKEQGLGVGSVVELTRSGLVIPKINKVLKSVEVDIPKKCPSCETPLIWESDFLMCTNHLHCPSQVIGRIEYFFKILANNDGFGIATIEKMYEHGIRHVSQIYTLTHDDLVTMGFGDKTSENLITQRNRSINEQVEDWRFLAAFGVPRMGMGNCENLLKFYPLEELFKLDLQQIANIDGFAELTAQLITQGLDSIHDEFNKLFQYGFNLERTKLSKDLVGLNHNLVGKKVVFTGKMHTSRDQMKKHAKSIGIQVASSVSSATDYLVIGENVGAKKIEKAQAADVEIITESEYLKIIDKA